jgi:flagellar assembly protein FliH
MPSSLDREVRPVELPDLTATGTRHVVPTQPLTPPPFVADEQAAPIVAPVFELGASGGVPEELLAPARAAAQAAGYAAGWAHGARAARLVSDAEAHVAAANRERAEERRDADVRRAIAALDAAATALEQRSVPSAHEIEDLIVSSALSIAEALIGVSLEDHAVRGRAALKRALALAPVGEDVTVALGPDDLAVVGDAAATDLTRKITLVEDASLAPGDATATCGATVIDARLSTGLARVRAVLTSGGAAR